MDQRVICGRGLDQARKKRGLCRRDVFCVLVEIRPGRRAHAISTMSEIDAVQVHAEDLVFGVALLERDCEDDLLDFSRDRFFRREQLDLHQLLCDRAAPLMQPA